MSTTDHQLMSTTPLPGAAAAARKRRLIALRRIAGAGFAVSSMGLVVTTLAPPAMADPAPVIHVGSDTRAKSQPQCMNDAEFAINSMGLQASRLDDIHVAGSGQFQGAGTSVIVTCLSLGPRTFIEVVGTSVDSGAAENIRNTVRSITMGVPS
jgi:hypothetical protein